MFIPNTDIRFWKTLILHLSALKLYFSYAADVCQLVGKNQIKAYQHFCSTLLNKGQVWLCVDLYLENEKGIYSGQWGSISLDYRSQVDLNWESNGDKSRGQMMTSVHISHRIHIPILTTIPEVLTTIATFLTFLSKLLKSLK